jgi:peptidyl-prolyl cis-trans isomerase A (cyclophilin A)
MLELRWLDRDMTHVRPESPPIPQLTALHKHWVMVVSASSLAVAQAPLAAQTAPAKAAVPVSAPAAAPSPAPGAAAPLPHVALETSMGTIVLRIESVRAPKTAANFLKYVDMKRYDGQSFYRSTRNWGAPSTVIQAGVRTDARLLLPPVAHEPTSMTGLMHCPGSVSLARNAPGTGRSDIFLALGPIYGFDADPKAAGDNAGFAVFAEVVSGWSVAEAIAAAPVSETAGDGVMKGQMLTPAIKILRARRVPPPSALDPAKPKPGCTIKIAPPAPESPASAP